MSLSIRQSDISHKIKHLCICEPIDPLMVVSWASNISFIHKVLERIMQIELKYTFLQTIILVSFGLFVWEQFFHFAFLLRPK